MHTQQAVNAKREEKTATSWGHRVTSDSVHDAPSLSHCSRTEEFVVIRRHFSGRTVAPTRPFCFLTHSSKKDYLSTSVRPVPPAVSPAERGLFVVNFLDTTNVINIIMLSPFGEPLESSSGADHTSSFVFFGDH